MSQLYIKTPFLRRGKIKQRKVRNIGKVKGVDTFLLDQNYAFQCAPMGSGEESITVIRMTIPKGTPVEQGYLEVWNSLKAMQYDPYTVLQAMGFYEVVQAVSDYNERILMDVRGEVMGDLLGCTA